MFVARLALSSLRCTMAWLGWGTGVMVSGYNILFLGRFTLHFNKHVKSIGHSSPGCCLQGRTGPWVQT